MQTSWALYLYNPARSVALCQKVAGQDVFRGADFDMTRVYTGYAAFTGYEVILPLMKEPQWQWSQTGVRPRVHIGVYLNSLDLGFCFDDASAVRGMDLRPKTPWTNLIWDRLLGHPHAHRRQPQIVPTLGGGHFLA